MINTINSSADSLVDIAWTAGPLESAQRQISSGLVSCAFR
jgi:hypothetical protein